MSDRVDFEIIDVSEDFAEANKYGIQATPTFIILAGDGTVLETLVGTREKQELESLLDRAARQ